MLFEREQGKLVKNCRTSKNYVKHIVMEQVKIEKLQRVRRQLKMSKYSNDNRPYIYSCNSGKVVPTTKPTGLNVLKRKDLFMTDLFPIFKLNTQTTMNESSGLHPSTPLSY